MWLQSAAGEAIRHFNKPNHIYIKHNFVKLVGVGYDPVSGSAHNGDESRLSDEASITNTVENCNHCSEIVLWRDKEMCIFKYYTW